MYAVTHGSKTVAAAALGWGVLNLAIGGVVTVLPLPILPFAPEQSLSHYGAHVVYTLGQVPLVLVAWRTIRAPATETAFVGDGRSGEGAAEERSERT